MKYSIIQVFARSRTVSMIISLVIVLTGVVSFNVGCGPRNQAIWELSQFVLGDSISFELPSNSTTVNIVQGKNLFIKAEIHNIGDTTGDYEWKIYIDDGPDPIYNQTTRVGDGQKSVANAPYLIYPTPESITLGVHEVTIGQVTLHFTVISPTAAEISAVTVVPTTIALLNADLTITGKVKNPGSNNEDYILHLIVDGYSVGQPKHYTVPRFSTVEFTFFIHNEYNYGCGNHSIKITVDGSSSQGTGEFQVSTSDCPGTGTSGTGTSNSPLSTGTPLALASVTLPDGVVGESYTTGDVKPTGGITPYSYSVTAGSLPAGLSIVPGADYFRIEGTPTTHKQYEFEITVDDNTASTTAVKATFKLTVFPNLKGTWTYSIAVTHAEGVCQGEEGPAHSRVITITQSGRKVTFSGFSGDPNNRLNGEILPPNSSSNNNEQWVNKTEQWVVYVAGSYWEDGGTTSSMHRLVINTASDMSGDESWTWTGGGGTCPNGKGSITATRISGP